MVSLRDPLKGCKRWPPTVGSSWVTAWITWSISFHISFGNSGATSSVMRRFNYIYVCQSPNVGLTMWHHEQSQCWALLRMLSKRPDVTGISFGWFLGNLWRGVKHKKFPRFCEMTWGLIAGIGWPLLEFVERVMTSYPLRDGKIKNVQERGFYGLFYFFLLWFFLHLLVFLLLVLLAFCASCLCSFSKLHIHPEN